MGAGPSTSAVSPELANKLLTAIFTQTDMGAYLSMTDPKACANFDFSSVNPGAQQQLQAAGGQLRVVGQGQNAEKLTICFDEAKGYSKGFEIFAALYPLLADSAVKRAGVSLLGGRRQTRRVQRGGKLRSDNPNLSVIKTTPYYAMNFIKDFEVEYNKDTQSLDFILRLTESSYRITFTIPIRDIKSDNLTVRGLGFTGSRTIPPKEISLQILLRDQKTYDFLINGLLILQFYYEGNQWSFAEFINSSPVGTEKEITTTVQKSLEGKTIAYIREITGLTSDAAGQGGYAYGGQGQAQAQAYGVQGQGQGQGQAPLSLSGSFFPQGPANVKKGLSNMKAKKVNPPLALAIARALILLKQIDPANIRGPPTTQICSRNYTFEGKDANVPRKGIPLEKTFYFKSWMNLFNDIGEYRQGKYEWTQSSGGRAKLEEAAKDLSVLYSSQLADPKFLSKPLPEFIKACPNRFEGEYLIPPQVLPQIQAIVQKLLQVQTTYAGRANAILAKVFVFKADGTVSFRPEILGRRGYQNLSALCVETRETLFDYYMRVESLFIEGLIIYEQAVALGVLKPV